MSKEVFIISDTHFGHEAMYSKPFLREDGTPMRPFRSAEEADEIMVQRWNAVVKPTDRLYHLGDVAIPRRGLQVLDRLNGKKVLIKGNHECVDTETEALTRSGWKRWDEISTDDEVWSLGGDGVGQWGPVQDVIVRHHVGSIIKWKNQFADMLMTPGHRVLVREEDNRYFLASELLDQNAYAINRVPRAAASGLCDLVEWDDLVIDDSLLRLVGWILTDGGMTWHGNHCAIKIYQSKLDSFAKLISDLQDFGCEYSTRTRPPKKAGTIVCGKALKRDSLPAQEVRLLGKRAQQLAKLIGTKKILPAFCQSLSDRQALVFIRALMIGDGAWGASMEAGGLHGSKAFLESVMIFCVTHGIGASLYEVKNREAWVLNVNLRPSRQGLRVKTLRGRSYVSPEDYDGIVWCVSTPLTNFFVRRGGKAYFTGNCFGLKDYATRFDDIRAYWKIENFFLSHVPIHPNSIRNFDGNIHGHLHYQSTRRDNGVIDPRYLCVCVEHTDYTPISWEEVKRRF